MIFEKQQDNPFKIQISFHKVIETLEEIALSDVDYRSAYAKGLLREVAKVPELNTGINSEETIRQNKALIRNLLADLFPTALTKNEIKAVTIPFQNLIFNYTERFQGILNNAGPDFDIEIRDFDSDHFYIMSCCLILNMHYGYSFDFSKPFFYDIPDAQNVVRHYRILYNANFIEIVKTEASIDISSEDVELLMDNFHDIALWKMKFPADSWLLRGFGIMSLYDATTESAVSNLKTSLLAKPEYKSTMQENFEEIFRSIFNFSDLRVGYSALNAEGNQFIVPGFDKKINSFLLMAERECAGFDLSCNNTLEALINERKYLSISDIAKMGKEPGLKDFSEHLLSQDIKSAIFAPVIVNEKLLGIVEIVSSKNKQLNSINANKMDIVMPYLIDTIDRYNSEIEYKVEALIQKEYTTIHPSVYWKFRDEAIAHINDTKDTVLHEIVFEDVYPLFGQIDIKGSSTARNSAVQLDLGLQIDLLKNLFKEISEVLKMPVIYQNVFELEQFETALETAFRADTESVIQNYILGELHPLLEHFKKSNKTIERAIAAYFETLDPKTSFIYQARKDFDVALTAINKKMASLLDKKQESAQAFFPHYYERFKTDGVEHNMYIGASIAPKLDYNPIYLNNLRLWQLATLCEMENEYFKLRESLPYDLDVVSLILVFSTPISIRFRMDEKHFDVDGAYNARYEMVKKRIDKSHIKATDERIAQKGKITIVYSQSQEEKEYRKYIRLLQAKNMLGNEIESFDVEDLQAVTGLKALRVNVIYNEANLTENYSYNDLIDVLKD
jgi:hypothetical protein